MTDSERARLKAEYGDVGKPVRVSAPSRWEAVLLGVLTPGLGHFYAGDLRRGLGWWSAILAWIFATAWLGLWDRFWGLLVALAVALGILLASLIDAALVAVRRYGRERQPYQRWEDYVGYVLFAALVVTPLYLWVLPVQTFAIPSESMMPALVPGDRVMARKIFGSTDETDRGATVIVRDEESETFYVYRVVGLPGETIEIRGRTVFVDGEPIDDPWGWSAGSGAAAPPAMREHLDDFGPERVPGDAVFVLGDNRDRSVDSRMRGPIPLDTLHARPLYVYWSSNDRSRIGRRVE